MSKKPNKQTSVLCTQQNSCIEAASAQTKPEQAHAKQNHRTEMEIGHIMLTLAVELLSIVSCWGKEREFSQECDP